MKKIICLISAIVMMIGMYVPVNAENELADAENYTLGISQSGSILEDNERDVYKFHLDNPSMISLDYTAELEKCTLKIYDEMGNEIWSENPNWNSTTETINYQTSMYICKGDYYFSVYRYYGVGDYDFTINCTEVHESFPEKQNGENQTVKTANKIMHGEEYTGCITLMDDVDVYSFNLYQAGKLEINYVANMERNALKIYDEMGNEIWSENPNWNSTTQTINFKDNVYLSKGDYYFSVSKYYGCGEYEFSLMLTGAFESFAEKQNGSNNTVKEAAITHLNQKYNGCIVINDNVDMYRVVIPQGVSSVTLNFEGDYERAALKLYDSAGNEVWSDNPMWNDVTELITYSAEQNLTEGLYYFSVSEYYGHGFYSFYFTDGGEIIDAPDPNSVINVLVNGTQVQFDQTPVLENGRTLVPLRAIFEALGAEVLWDGNTQTVTATKDGTQISLQIGSTQMYVNEYIKILDVPAKLINSRTLVPVRAISEAFGCNVDWIQDTQTVVITQ